MDDALKTDLYQLTMAAGYLEHRMTFPATFELFVRELPLNRGYLVAAGLQQCLEYLEELRFGPAEIDFLRSLPIFRHVSGEFFEYLRAFRFQGELDALAEGTVFFAGEPVLSVTASLPEAQMVETYLLSTINFQTSVATKAARIVETAAGREVVEFGSRRAHGPEAGMVAARAAYIGGCAGTSNLLAGRRFGIPVYGTIAHSWIMACPSEEEAFRRFRSVYHEDSILVVDTYDTLRAVETIARMGAPLRAVRLDSGDLGELARRVRQILDREGMYSTRIVASGDLNEYKIAELVRDGAPLDSFAVGTDLATSRDAPALGGVYKLVEHAGDGKALRCYKDSPGKQTLPGRKQITRHISGDRIERDTLGLREEKLDGCPLLVPEMRNGRRLRTESLPDIRQRARAGVRALPESARRLQEPEPIPVEYSPDLRALLEARGGSR